MGDFIYLFIGFAFGCAFMLNRKEYKQKETYEQMDERLRDDLVMYKNLSESLKSDLDFAKKRIQDLKEKL